MSDRLRELLSETPTEQEIDLAFHESPADHERTILANRYSSNRATLVRSTLRECAKVVCPMCARGIPAERDNVGDYGHSWNGHYEDVYCRAGGIHALLAETEAKV